jgi:hypothetical protein
MDSTNVRHLLDLIKQQNKAIEKLIAERDGMRQEIAALVGWIQEDRDALMCLQSIYNSPTADEASRIKAASAAIGYERGKPAQVSVVIDFKERVRTARLRQLELDRAEWARQDAEKKQPLDLNAEPAPTVLGGPPEEGWDPNDPGHEGEADPAA